MTRLADLLATVFERRQRGERVRPRFADRPLPELAHALLGSAGEASGLALAEAVLARYEALDDAGRRDFLSEVARTMDIDPRAVRAALEGYEARPARDTYQAFAAAAEPPRQELIRRLNQAPGATTRLVRMRADLLRLGRGDPPLEALDQDFRHLFASWFNRGFLVLRRISWESPAHILEKIIAYEAVHAIDSWDDLRRRLQPEDRRCYAFFHPAMPDEPLIFVEVALTRGVPSSIQALLAEDRPPLPAEEADAAVFYSISNCQKGLSGISFGNSLIKQVAADLAADLPQLSTFVTLSPIPRLVEWLEREGVAWDPADPERMRRLAAWYLLNAKGRDGMPFDPVARFHLGNGAIVHAVHADADVSPKGRAQSGGAMVNYLYDLGKVAQNHEAFVARREVRASAEVRALAERAQISPTEER
ncbi:malonyl-CoA decarboxylase [Oceanicella actignis]|uniref:malonyl-CoA decarboxylase n=1 Tax=Oceanicella actignis TaxID=1189325 RepID=UPI0011E7A13E|nr:malonyl-CoA decarboxylase [Oceanicella actignis]TYO89102.1 malonyl-CoA decarboxylase [Oceanicella actignis]